MAGSQTLAHLSSANQAALTGHSYLPQLIWPAFHSGLNETFIFAIIAGLIAAAASWSRGKPSTAPAVSAITVGPVEATWHFPLTRPHTH